MKPKPSSPPVSQHPTREERYPGITEAEQRAWVDQEFTRPSLEALERSKKEADQVVQRFRDGDFSPAFSKLGDGMKTVTAKLEQFREAAAKAGGSLKAMGDAVEPIFVRGGPAHLWDLKTVPVSPEVAEEIEKHIRTCEENRVSTLHVHGGTLATAKLQADDWSKLIDGYVRNTLLPSQQDAVARMIEERFPFFPDVEYRLRRLLHIHNVGGSVWAHEGRRKFYGTESPGGKIIEVTREELENAPIRLRRLLKPILIPADRVQPRMKMRPRKSRWVVVFDSVMSWSVAVCSRVRTSDGGKRFAMFTITGTAGHHPRSVKEIVALADPMKPTTEEPSEEIWP